MVSKIQLLGVLSIIIGSFDLFEGFKMKKNKEKSAFFIVEKFISSVLLFLLGFAFIFCELQFQ